jgi:MerR family transcriptional regulator/heat shock protein HspR
LDLPRKFIMSETRPDDTVTHPGDEPVYVISIAAKLAGLPSWTLRVLDKEGIVCPQRTAKDRRLYSDRDIARLARVRFLTEERGVNMNGVRLILEIEDQNTPSSNQETASKGDNS